jgi:hypothetical protein
MITLSATKGYRLDGRQYGMRVGRSLVGRTLFRGARQA